MNRLEDGMHTSPTAQYIRAHQRSMSIPCDRMPQPQSRSCLEPLIATTGSSILTADRAVVMLLAVLEALR